MDRSSSLLSFLSDHLNATSIPEISNSPVHKYYLVMPDKTSLGVYARDLNFIFNVTVSSSNGKETANVYGYNSVEIGFAIKLLFPSSFELST